SIRMDYPWATANWISTLGFFAWPDCRHYYWDVLVEVLGERVGAIRYALPEEFSMNHDQMSSENVNTICALDAREMVPTIGLRVPRLVTKLFEAILRSEP